MLTDEFRYKILKLVSDNPEISQRELARQLGISLGRANYCLKALIDKGILKASNFRNNNNKLAYMYLLTPDGVELKARITVQYLKWKLREYETLQAEIEELRREAAMLDRVTPTCVRGKSTLSLIPLPMLFGITPR
ncbi:MAG: MarR family EPS-associated transcriptional regulator [Methylococcaceae bacterium]|nr:MarR family EPS-associated transcriptional regulator [Methylococcaceae bacterium]